MNNSIINSIGLCLDIIGAAIIFFNSPEKSYTTYLYRKAELEKLNIKAKKTRKKTQIGFAFLALGFILQLISDF